MAAGGRAAPCSPGRVDQGSGRAGASAPASVSVRVTSGGDAPVKRLVEPGGDDGTEIGTGSTQLAVRVLDKAGEILDHADTRTIQPAAVVPLALTPGRLSTTPKRARFGSGRPGARRPRVQFAPDRLRDSPPHLRHVGGGRGGHRAPDR